MKQNNVVILHDIRSVENVGSLFRTAECAGVSKIYLTGITPGPLDRFGRVRKDLAKVSLGAEKSVPWEDVEIMPLLKKLKGEGFTIVCIEQDKSALDYKTYTPKAKAAFILGSEVGGIPKEILEQSDVVVAIPLRGEKESLNVAVAGGIALFRMLNV